MPERPRTLFKALVEDGETVVLLLSDGRYKVSSEPASVVKSLFPRPASPRPDADDGPPKGTPGGTFFKPGKQGARMPNGLWNSSVPLPGHSIEYAEGDAGVLSDRRKLGGGK